MHERILDVRQKLSRLKNNVISHDLQDIYQILERAAAPRSTRGLNAERKKASFEIHDQVEVLELIDQINPLNDQGRRFARDRLQAGDKAIIGYLDKTPVFYGWLMFNEIEMTYGRFLPISGKMAFAYNLYTRKTHRRLGIMSDFYSFVCPYLKRNDIASLYCGIATHNTASINAHLKNGFAKSGYFYTLKVLGTCFTLARFTHAKRFYVMCD